MLLQGHNTHTTIYTYTVTNNGIESVPALYIDHTASAANGGYSVVLEDHAEKDVDDKTATAQKLPYIMTLTL